MVSGSVEGRTTCPKLRADLNTVLTCFSPISKDKELLMPGDKTEIDVLIATDCISEGQNLQDCDYLINYDIHWNPVRIIQRFGRIDRIGSRNKVIQLVNFWPDVTLDDYINLKAKVETRMKIVDMTATGDDNLLSDEEKTDLEYRKAQLKRLQDEVVDIEDISYDTIEGEYDSSIFTAEKATQSFDKAFLAKKAIQDYVFTDGSADKSIERKFAEDLDAADEVCVYAKLPRTFQIPTPVGNYSPDWAIAFYEGTVKHIFFIAETKGTMESLELRPIEQAKISCAKKLFNEMSTSNVVYHDVDSYQSLLNIMNSL